jgi:FkbM family methyltransferase
VIGAIYRRARRKAASFLNGWLMPRAGLKLVRSYPKTYRYEKTGTSSGRTTLAVTGGSPARTVTVRLREGTSDWMTFDQVFLEEDYDLRPLPRYGEIAQTYRELSRRGTPLIVDLGANIGLSPLYFAMTWPEAKVVGLEPDPGNFVLFRENVAGVANIEAVQAGAASRATMLNIVDPSAGKNAFRTAVGEGGKVTVEGRTIGAIVEEYRAKGCLPFAIKIDIEGAEAELFSGDYDWVDEFPLIMIELHDWLFPGEGTSRPFLRAIAEKDRDFVYLDENVFSIRNRRAA